MSYSGNQNGHNTGVDQGGKKMPKKSRQMMFIFVMSVMLLLIAACGGKEQTAPPEEEDNTPVKLNVYIGGWTQERFMEAFGDQVQQKYPNVSFEVFSGGEGQNVPDLIASGVKLDIVQSTVPSLIVDNGLQDDLTDLIKKYNYDVNKLDPAVLEAMKSIGNGVIYGIPNGIATAALFYNKDIFDKFGVDYPTHGMTWDEVYELAPKLTKEDGGVQYAGFQPLISALLITNQLSQGFVDSKTEKATLNNDNWKAYFENFARFFRIPGNELVSGANDAIHKEKRIAMWATQFGATVLTGLTNAEVNWGVVSLPEFKEKPGIGPGVIIPLFYVAKGSQYRDWAFKTVAVFGSEEFQAWSAEKVGASTAMKNRDKVMENFARDVPTIPADKRAQDALPKTFASPYAVTYYDSVVQRSLNAAFSAVASGQKDVNTALREAEEEANIAIEEARQKRK